MLRLHNNSYHRTAFLNKKKKKEKKLNINLKYSAINKDKHYNMMYKIK